MPFLSTNSLPYLFMLKMEKLTSNQELLMTNTKKNSLNYARILFIINHYLNIFIKAIFNVFIII